MKYKDSDTFLNLNEIAIENNSLSTTIQRIHFSVR